jgi:hypothetical protein
MVVGENLVGGRNRRWEIVKVRATLVLVVVWLSVACIGFAGASNPGDIHEDSKVAWLDVKMMGENWLSAAPTPADIDNSGDVYFPDLAILPNNWGWVDPSAPNDMVLIGGGTFQMGDSFGEAHSNERPVHTVILDSFYMGKYEVTNGQYCQYLNSALGSSIYVSGGLVYGIGNDQPYCDTSIRSPYSQIDYDDVSGTFSVRTEPAVGGRDMSNDPMVHVSRCGSVAYCSWRSRQEGKEQCYSLSTWTCNFNKKGYRLARHPALRRRIPSCPELLVLCTLCLSLLDEPFLNDFDDYLLGVKAFDNLTYGQKVTVLSTIANWLLRRDVPIVELTAVLEGAIADELKEEEIEVKRTELRKLCRSVIEAK